MVNTRAKIKKIENYRYLWSSDADSNHHAVATESGALIGSNDDLLIEILRRLPVASVLLFKSVSKHWRSLLTHPRFTLMFNKKKSISPGVFICDLYVPYDPCNQINPPFRDFNFYPQLFNIYIVHSCNGLLLCCNKMGYPNTRKYHVFNPTTKQFARIPSVIGRMDVDQSTRFMGLAFHQTACVHYKVISITHIMKSDPLFQIQIYSSETGKWRILNEPFTAPYNTRFSYGVYLNQAFYWAPSGVNQMYLNLDTEELKSLPLPEAVASYEDGAMPLYFGESRGHLHLVEAADRFVSCLHLDVYEMLNDRSGWFLKYRVELDQLPDAYPEMIMSDHDPSSPGYYGFELFDVVRGEEDDETFMLIKIRGKIIRYNVVDKSFKQISDLSDMCKVTHGQIGPSQVHRYIENLTSF